MDTEKLMHDQIIDRIRARYAREYKDIKVNAEGDPDIILASHGLTIAMVEVETENSVTAEKAKKWKALTESGSKLIVMVPQSARVRTTDLLWQQGIADKVRVGSYEIKITMP